MAHTIIIGMTIQKCSSARAQAKYHGGNCHIKLRSKSAPSKPNPKFPSDGPNGAIDGSKGKESQL